MLSNTFDYATSCSAENSCLVHESMRNEMRASFKKVGACLVQPEKKMKLQAAMWPDGVHLNRDIVAQSPIRIAEMAEINLPEG
ncbi:MAG: hypothetical protein B6D68_02280 [spirochete symbiont of Stewartia floridana]|nr:MAG: hypothetical protein B6D68_02280 [spirochete symbiont of Stewartia floridana]